MPTEVARLRQRASATWGFWQICQATGLQVWGSPEVSEPRSGCHLAILDIGIMLRGFAGKEIKILGSFLQVGFQIIHKGHFSLPIVQAGTLEPAV